MRLYIAGPMSGFDQHNFPAFDAARDVLVACGHEVISPADITRGSGVPFTTDGVSTPEQYAAFLRLDVAALLTVDAVAVLRGWQRSRGAKLEVHIAQTLGLPILRVPTLEELDVQVYTVADAGDDTEDDRCEACGRWRDEDAGFVDADDIWVCTPCGAAREEA